MLAENLKRLREDKGLTRPALGLLSGVHPNTIADIECGRNQAPAYDKVVNLAVALGVEPSELWPIATSGEAAS